MENIKWYQRPMRIFDFIPPGEEDLLKIDMKELSKDQSELKFNTQHIEVMEIKEGASDKIYFNCSSFTPRADLLKTIVDENRKNGIRNIIYFNVHWGAERLVELHPEWMQRNSAGELLPSGYGVGSVFCVNSSFRQWAQSIIEDLAQYDIDGIFLDGPFFKEKACFCDACKTEFKNRYGYELDESVFDEHNKYIDHLNFKKNCIGEFVRDCRDTLKSIKPDAVIYMNSIQLNGDKYCSRDNNLTIEYQDILGAEGGFLYCNLRESSIFKPGMTAKLIETQSNGKPTVVFIAGRWSPWTRTLLTPPESWIVHAEAVANGANTWYGIHVENCKDKFMEEICAVNSFVEKNVNYYIDTKSLAKTAILWSGKTANFYQSSAALTDFTQANSENSQIFKSDMTSDFHGWYEMLSKNHVIFDVIDDFALANKDVSKYDTIILPNVSCMSKQEVEKIKEFVNAGGNIISTYDTSMFNEWGQELQEPLLKDVLGLSSFEGKEVQKYGHVKFEESALTTGIIQSFIAATNLYMKVIPENNTEKHMCFRKKQPSVYCDIMPPTNYPFIIVNSYGKGKSVYFPGNIGLMYNKYQLPEYKRIAGNILRYLNEPQLQILDEIDSIDISYRSNGKENILHVINYTGAMTRPIEKILTLKNVRVRIFDKEINEIFDAKREVYLSLTKFDNYIEVTLPELKEYEVYVLRR